MNSFLQNAQNAAEALGQRVQGLIGARFLDRLVSSPRGRAFELQFMVGAEEADEIGVFDKLLATVDDPKLRKMVEFHVADEERHAKMLRDRVTSTGIEPVPTPERLRIVAWINEALGDPTGGFVGQKYGVMEAYLFLLVLEERAVINYPLIARAMRRVDPKSAAVIGEIAEDEKRHVKYAAAISRKYAPDQATWERTLHRYRRAEIEAFRKHGPAFIEFAVGQGLLDVSWPESAFWQAMATLPGLAPLKMAGAQPALAAA